MGKVKYLRWSALMPHELQNLVYLIKLAFNNMIASISCTESLLAEFQLVVKTERIQLCSSLYPKCPNLGLVTSQHVFSNLLCMSGFSCEECGVQLIAYKCHRGSRGNARLTQGV